MASPTRSSSAGSHVAARMIVTGNAVECPITTPRGPSLKRMPGMPSRDTAPPATGPALISAGNRSIARAGTSPSSNQSSSSSVISRISDSADSRADAEPALSSFTRSAKGVMGPTLQNSSKVSRCASGDRLMDFSRVALSHEDQAFQDELRAFLDTIVTDEVIARDRQTGENFDEGVHLALGDAGYLAADFKDEADGGFSRLRRRIWNLEIGRAHTPWFHWGTTAMVARAVEAFGSPELKAELMPKVLAGRFRLCLGYTEPDGGSDVATCKTRAVRDGDGWIIN